MNKKTGSKAEQYFPEGVYSVMLTNEERRYLALNDLRPEWETAAFYSVTHFRKKRTVLFYEKDTIVKVIYEEHSFNKDGSVVWKQYSEYDTCLETDSRKMLLPLTARGRAKPVTASNVLAVNPFGCIVKIQLRPDASTLWAGNFRNSQKIAVGEENRIRKILSDDDFHRFMQYFISTCPDNYFDRIAEVREMEHQTVRFRAGDIFRCQTDREHYTYGIILVRTRELEKWGELPAKHSFRNLMTQPIIVRMYDFASSDADISVGQLSKIALRPPMICSDGDIIWGKHKIIAHKDPEPGDIQFQFHLRRQGSKNEYTSLWVEWGFVSIEIPWEKVPDEVRELLNTGVYYENGVLLGISGRDCGRTLADILRETPKNRIQYDLLLPENREKFNLVMNALGMRDDCSYDEFAEKYGGITRQKYIELLQKKA